MTENENSPAVPEDVQAGEEKTPFDPKQWYEDRKDEIAEKRKEKYDSDPEHRARVRARSREYQRRKAEEKRQAQGNGVVCARVRRPRRPKAVRLADGSTVQMYTVGTLANAIGKTTQTVSKWENEQFIPSTPFRAAGDVRLFSQKMIEAVADALLVVEGRIRFDDDTVRLMIEESWAALGYGPNVQYEVV